jgi:hypothetical protein
VPGPHGAREEARLQVPGVEKRPVDGLLQVHAVMDQPQQERRLPLVLLVAAGGAEGVERPSAPAPWTG